jgi:hypothetical protein
LLCPALRQHLNDVGRHDRRSSRRAGGGFGQLNTD